MIKQAVPPEARRACEHLHEVFAETLVAIYLFGSAVHDGLRPDSDVDLLVVIAGHSTREQRQVLLDRLLHSSGRIGNSAALRPLELTLLGIDDLHPWHFPPTAQFVYGEWLREQLERNGCPVPAADPDLALVLQQVRECAITLFGPAASELLPAIPPDDLRRAIATSLPTLLENLHGDERNVLLTLARMWFSASNGSFTSKHAAADWACARLPAAEASLLRIARDAYLGLAKDDWSHADAHLAALVRRMRQALESCLAR